MSEDGCFRTSSLSKSESNVANWLASGLTNREIAGRLCVDEKTVKFHLTSIYRKTGVKSRAEFIVRYIDKNDGHFCVPEKVKEEKVTERFPTGARPLEQGARAVQVVSKTQEDKVKFIDDTFKVSDTIESWKVRLLVGGKLGEKEIMDVSRKDYLSETIGNTKQSGNFVNPFPKRQIPVQVGVGSPHPIGFELTSRFHSVSSNLIQFNLIFGGKLGESRFSRIIPSSNSPDAADPSLPQFCRFRAPFFHQIQTSLSFPEGEIWPSVSPTRA